jgi:hypothetical protein
MVDIPRHALISVGSSSSCFCRICNRALKNMAEAKFRLVLLSVWCSDGLRTGRPGFDSRQCKIFLFSTAFRPTLGPTQPPIQRLPGAFSLGIKRQGREADHSPPTSAEIRKGGAIPPLPHTSSWNNA